METIVIDREEYEIVRTDTVKGQQILDYASEWYGDIYATFLHPSDRDIRLFNYWKTKCDEMDGEMFCVCTKTAFNFCVSWASRYGVHYVTPNHNYLVADHWYN